MAHARGWCLFATALLFGCINPQGFDRDGAGGTSVSGAAGDASGGGVIGAAGGSSAGAGSGGRASGGTNPPAGVAGSIGGGGSTSLGGTVGSGAGGSGAVTGAAGAPMAGTVLYSDTFETDAVGGMAEGWIQGDTSTGLGTWKVVKDGSNVLVGAATGSDFTADIGGNLSWTDYTIAVDVKLTAGNGSFAFGLYGRYAIGTDKANYYTAYVDDSNQAQVRVRYNGGTTQVGGKSKSTTGNATLNTTYHLVLDMHGSTITFMVNGVMRVMASDMTLASGGIGLIVENATAEFDNVVVTR
jgi:3-keto-disaccharide hydrolase